MLEIVPKCGGFGYNLVISSFKKAGFPSFPENTQGR
jgi:hypothetical protein